MVEIKNNELEIFKIDDELDKFSLLEKEVNDTIFMLNGIIELFSNKTEVAKGSTGKLVLLIEQKISLLTRKESIIRNIADMKKNLFNTNSKIKSSEDGDTDLAKVMMEYTEVIKKQHKAIEEARDTIKVLVSNEDEVQDFFQ